MAYFYYEQNGQNYQVTADSYRRVAGSTNVVPLNWPTQNGPIRATYDSKIISVQSLGGTWSPNPTLSRRPCPTDLNFVDNSISHPFDHPYEDNEGICSYLVTLTRAPCNTNFYTNGTISQSLDFCPPINNDPRNPGCEDCCRELLPSMRSLHI